MDDEDVVPDLVELLRQKIGLASPPRAGAHDDKIRVLEGVQHIVHNAIDVVLDPFKTKEAAEMIYRMMQRKKYSTKAWAEHPLHPKTKDEGTVDFIFTMDLLNFSFWSDEQDPEKQFAIEYRGKRWNGYSSLVGSLQRTLDEGIPITTPSFWIDEEKCSIDTLRHVFRSATSESIPMFEERVRCLREAGQILVEKYDGSFVTCIEEANGCAGYLVNLVADDFPCFHDSVQLAGKEVQIYKRAQILVADIWACFNGKDYGRFKDIDQITMFADYRIPQILQHLGCIRYSPPLEMAIRDKKLIPSGSSGEVEIRASTVWCVEMIRREIMKKHPETALQTEELRSLDPTSQEQPVAPDETSPPVKQEGLAPPNVSPPSSTMARVGTPMDTRMQDFGTPLSGTSIKGESQPASEAVIEKTTPQREKETETPEEEEEPKIGVNAILIDFLLYDTMKELQAAGLEEMPHHRTRSIWY